MVDSNILFHEYVVGEMCNSVKITYYGPGLIFSCRKCNNFI